jgi:hypothetical protein
MKNTPFIVGLFLAVAALGFWSARLESKIAAADTEIAALKTKLNATEHVAQLAKVQSAQRLVEVVAGAAAPASGGTIATKQDPADPREALTAAQAALAQAQALPAGTDRDTAMKNVESAFKDSLIALAAQDPQAAWDAAQNMPDDSHSSRLLTLRGILQAWSSTNPAKAAALMTEANMTEASDNATNTAAIIESNWIKQDSVAASQWINTLPPGNTRDSAIQALVQVVKDTDPAGAMTWTDTMTDFSTRGNMITKIVQEWAKTDPAAATQAVLNRTTGKNRQQALLDIINQTAASAANGSASAAAPGP